VVGAALLLVCVLVLFVRGEVALRLQVRRGPSRLRDYVSATMPRMARRIFTLARIFAGMRMDFRRFPGRLPPVFLIVSNHQSLADIPAIAIAFSRHPLRFLAKKELGRGVPYVSAVLRLGRQGLISRTSNFREGQRELKRFAAMSKEGICPVIFPEGTRSRTGRVNEFYAGGVRVALETAPVPVLSVAVDGGYRISRLPQIIHGLRGTVYRVKPLTLYAAPRGKQEITDLLAKIHAEISAEVDAWHAQGGAETPRQ
jgi:1-acyl-sn-glycerol-3-phosphate acyltransferase